MGFTAIVTDSTAGLKPEYAVRHQVTIIPLYVKMGDKVMREGIELDADTFYQELPHTNPLPTTSQPSVGDFTSVYEEAIRRGATSIISIHLSAGISGTINSATLAAQPLGVPVEIIDTRSAMAAHYLITQACVSALENGASFEEAVTKTRLVCDTQRTIFIPETLEYLYKGGRIGGAAALMGSLLQMKPLLVFKDGKIDALERVRSLNRAYARMVEVMAEWMGTTEPMRVMVMQAQREENAAQVMELVRSKLNVAIGEMQLVTPVIGAHTGPGTVGICCCPVSACGSAVD
ncbi:MAG: DegV family protein [Chloroflexi bacterium]|nr:DegV family protein [Chloroflexota bacterium]